MTKDPYMKMCEQRSTGRDFSTGSAALFTTRIVLPILLALSIISCRHRVPVLPGETEPIKVVQGEGLEILAGFPEKKGIEKLFHMPLPDSGIVPVKVVIRNNDARPFRIHSPNNLDIGRRFEGFTLVANEKEFLPVHPVEVFISIKGRRLPSTYRKPNPLDIFSGVLFPPLGAYYIYREAKAGRYYKPLFRESIYPAVPGGLFEPIEIAPGQGVEGYLYYRLPPEENPYIMGESDSGRAEGQVADEAFERLAGRRTSYRAEGRGVVEDTLRRGEQKKSDRARSRLAAEIFGHFASTGEPYVLIVRPSLTTPEVTSGALSVRDTLPLYDVKFPRLDGSGKTVLGGAGGLPRQGNIPFENAVDFFALKRPCIKGKRGCLALGRISAHLLRRPLEGLEEIAAVSSKRAEIADASRFGSLSACALNFKAKSRIFLITDGDGEPKIIGKKDLSRRVMRIFLSADGFFAVTIDGCCHHFTYDGLRRTRYTRPGPDVHDAVLHAGCLLVFSERSLNTYGTSGEELLKLLERHPLPGARRRVVGPVGNRLALLHEGSKTQGDTLVLFDPGRAFEVSRMPFPGDVLEARSFGERIILELEGGILLTIDAGGEGPPGIESSAFLPFRAEALLCSGGEVVAVGGDGILATGSMEGALPVTPEDLVTGVTVEMPPAR